MAGPGGGAALKGASVRPPAIFPPAEPAPVTTTDSREHSKRPADAGPPPRTRQRVVLLPHARTESPDTQPQHRTAGP